MFVHKLREVAIRTDLTVSFYFILSLGFCPVPNVNVRKGIKRQIFLNKYDILIFRFRY